MLLVLTYDQLSEQEASDTFESVNDLKQFALDHLHGKYSMEMNWGELESQLEQHGYFVEVRD